MKVCFARKLIQVRHLTKIYTHGEVKVPALRNVSLDIFQGDFLFIVGRSGSGKSTLLRQLGLLDYPTSGEIYLNNIEVTKLSEKERIILRLKYLGYIFQEYALISELSALENVMLPAMMLMERKDCKKRAYELLSKVELKGRENHLPHQMSGGEQQRVAIARALINSPIVIFADEPTANLDTISASHVLKIFKKINQQEKITIVMVTHEPEEEKYASRVIKLSDGKIV